jgi:ABC-type polysaccharide/polyol phosphate export permease
MPERLSLFEFFKVKVRVIQALILREILTRYGRQGLGFLWLFLEPLLFLSVFVAIRVAFEMETTSEDLRFIVTFVITGILASLLWRNLAGRLTGAISGNIGLLYHRHIHIYDLFFARAILEFVTVTGLFIFLCLILIPLGFMQKPYDLFWVVIGWFLQMWFALGLGLFVGSLIHKWNFFGKIWSPTSLILFILGGTFYMVDWLPSELQKYALLIPTVHNIEMIRYGFFGPEITAYFDVGYSAAFNIFLTFLGFIFLRYVSLHFEPE